MAGVLIAIFLVSRGCQSEGIDLTKEQAIEIARKQVDFEPNLEVVRLIRRGVTFKPHWAVSLSREDENGKRTDATIVIIDAETGEVVRIDRDV
jgi:uncharacterized membrane protein YkoI